MNRVYLDHNASSAMDPAVLEAMRPHLLAAGNPESRHAHGRDARRAWNEARESVARILGAAPAEVVFTSGGTEANNLALLGLALDGAGRAPDGARLITSPIEHPAVSGPVAGLERRGYAVDHLTVGSDGVVDIEAASHLARDGTRLATLLLAHNETGAIQPVARLAECLGELGIPVHTDAVQAVGRIPLDFHGLGVATLACTAHKLHGPPGIGALLVRRGRGLTPTLLGGGQQGGLRPGTPPVALAVGFAAALELWDRRREGLAARWSRLREELESRLIAALGPDRLVRHGPDDPDMRLPQTSLLGFRDLSGDALLLQLDHLGVSVSLGAACASGATRGSDTLRAMGVADELARTSIRFSLGAETTAEEVREAAARVAAAVARIDAASAAIPAGES